MTRGRVEWRRLGAIVAVLGLLAGAGIANAVVRATRDRAASAAPAVDSTVEMSAATTSNAWYCPGPLPVGRSSASSSIAIANVEGTAVRGELVVANANGTTSRRLVRIRARSQSVVALATTGRPSSAAVSVLVDGGGVGVSEEVRSAPGGLSEATCVDHAAAREYLAAGGSKGANNVALALFDPGATPSVVSVSFSVGARAVAPPAFQGLPVPAGGVVVLDVGHYLPQQAAFATTVTSTGGWIVAGQSMAVLVNKALVSELVTASSQASSQWWFPPGPAGTDVRQDFAIANPNAIPAVVALRLSGAGPTISQSVSLAPGAATVFSPVPAPGAQSLRFAEVTSPARAPVVVQAETVVGRSIPPTVLPRRPRAVVNRTPRALSGAHAPAFGASALTRLLGLGPGYALTAPVRDPAPRWVLPGGENDTTTGESVFVANPTSVPVIVTVATLVGPRRASAPVIARVVIAPDGAEVVDAGSVVGTARTFPLLVSASTPVLAASLLYARGSRRSTGFSASIGIPED